MHEVSVAGSILDAVHAEAAVRKPARPVKVGVRVGEMAGIDPASLAFCFEALVQGTELDPLELEIECGSADELELSYLELEQT